MTNGESSYEARTNNRDEALLNLHIAEYSALVTRNAYWTMIQQNVWILVVLSLSFLATVWTVGPQHLPLIIWLAAIAVQAELLILGFATQEIYRNAYYIEDDLRRRIQKLIQNEDFWRYETFLVRSGTRKPLLTDILPAVLSVVGLATVVTLRLLSRARWTEQGTGLLANLPFTTLVFAQTRSVMSLRKKLEKAALTRAGTVEQAS